MGAGAINPFYNPQTSNPISMFVEDKLPVDLMFKAGLMKQQQQDETIANIAKLAVDPNAVYDQDKKARQAIANDVNKWVENSYSKDWTDPQNHLEFIRKANDIKNNEILRTTAANTANYNAWQEQIKKYKEGNNNEYADALEYLVAKKSNAYAKSGVVGNVGDLTQIKGVDTYKVAQEMFNDIPDSGAETIKNSLGVVYKTGWEGVTEKTALDRANSLVNTFANTQAGKQVLAEYQMIEDLNPEALQYEVHKKGKDGKWYGTGEIKTRTASEYLAGFLGDVAKERVGVKTTTNYDEAYYREASKRNADYERQVNTNDSEALKIFQAPGTTVTQEYLSKIFPKNADGTYNISLAGTKIVSASTTKLSPEERRQYEAGAKYDAFYKSKEYVKAATDFNEAGKRHRWLVNQHRAYQNGQGFWSDDQTKELNNLTNNLLPKLKNTYDEIANKGRLEILAKTGMTYEEALQSDGYTKYKKENTSLGKNLPETLGAATGTFKPTKAPTIEVDGVLYQKGTVLLTSDQFSDIGDTDDIKGLYAEKTVKNPDTGKVEKMYEVQVEIPLPDDSSVLATYDQQALGQASYSKNQNRLNTQYAEYALDKVRKAKESENQYNRRYEYASNVSNNNSKMISILDDLKKSGKIGDDDYVEAISIVSSKLNKDNRDEKALLFDILYNNGANSNGVNINTFLSSN